MNTPLPGQAGLIVAVPEAEPFVGDLRARFDFRSSEGVPTHITVLYPFESYPVRAATVDRLRQLFLGMQAFEFRLKAIVRWTDNLHLVPEQSDNFVALTKAVWAEFLSYPPYEGRFAEVVPHLSVAQAEARLLDEAEPLLREATPTNGIVAACSEIALLAATAGSWKVVERFALGSSSRGHG